jgi:hypothetical protein
MTRQIEGLKTIESAFLLEAGALVDAGLVAAAWPFYRRAAELECELADLFEAQGNVRDAGVSRFSAASCFLQARQYRTARELFRRVVDVFPEAEGLMTECGDKEDAPAIVQTPGLEALIGLLVRKGIISDDDWVQAVQTR